MSSRYDSLEERLIGLEDKLGNIQEQVREQAILLYYTIWLFCFYFNLKAGGRTWRKVLPLLPQFEDG